MIGQAQKDSALPMTSYSYFIKTHENPFFGEMAPKHDGANER
jgi:hypothetical protein